MLAVIQSRGMLAYIIIDLLIGIDVLSKSYILCVLPYHKKMVCLKNAMYCPNIFRATKDRMGTICPIRV